METKRNYFFFKRERHSCIWQRCYYSVLLAKDCHVFPKALQRQEQVMSEKTNETLCRDIRVTSQSIVENVIGLG